MLGKVLCVLAFGMLAGCGGFSMEQLVPGKTDLASVRQIQEPTAEWINTDGSRTLEYAWFRGYAQTWMLDFDSRGVLLGSRTVVNEKSAAQVRVAMTREEVRRILGKPKRTEDPVAELGEAWVYPLTQVHMADEVAPVIYIEFHPQVDAVRNVSVRNILN
ncbi:MAG: hypothetical protein CGU28_11665 [Candidatus Dactylopiibacterium carminicum]|uniref:Outer membrane protein assembly factor BamE n=1 Tax=Candidatus Dactylopiibacterium carminicum TaxID=857335 RepID=A0A272EQ36_9RHOO|nr:outer membrane protein assembly factor BamE [Candidatus Dactylopiibacterium carminicum]KAF7598447.1 outer membrane protein assembly factor BamE [Candidatus Dactylopiibacterium carminicum]PAS92223.1 MAG: hypothetical protein CGU29_12590 [Candidatus Dactylopiibacterium carminicum]PAS95738.1 MAG: hypothetical protein CGU28_11665 [Candidatus Dactylopiibacterium carminicum]PAS97766.1 MAG: hypothetical protein BSR46_13125 [Candidatus Dactylopiibacterium carminicum]